MAVFIYKFKDKEKEKTLYLFNNPLCNDCHKFLFVLVLRNLRLTISFILINFNARRVRILINLH